MTSSKSPTPFYNLLISVSSFKIVTTALVKFKRAEISYNTLNAHSRHDLFSLKLLPTGQGGVASHTKFFL